MNNLLSDTSTYISIDKNPLKKLQEKTSKILKNLNGNEFLKEKYRNNQLTLTSTVLPMCYELPKIHKKDQIIKTSEMIHIKFNKFSMNKKEDIFTLNGIYFSLLNRLNS